MATKTTDKSTARFLKRYKLDKNGKADHPAPPGYRWIVRLRDTHSVMGYWARRSDACEQASDWNRAHFDGSSQVYVDDADEQS